MKQILIILTMILGWGHFCAAQNNSKGLHIRWQFKNIRVVADDTLEFDLDAKVPSTYYVVGLDDWQNTRFSSPPLFVYVANVTNRETYLEKVIALDSTKREGAVVYANDVVYKGKIIGDGVGKQRRIRGKVTCMLITPNNKLKNELFDFFLINKSIKKKSISVGFKGYRKFIFDSSRIKTTK